jgi:hypothetical protein
VAVVVALQFLLQGREAMGRQGQAMEAAAAAVERQPEVGMGAMAGRGQAASSSSQPISNGMRYALVDKATKIVEGVILWDGEAFYSVAENIELIELGDAIAGPGWMYANGTFTAPTE